MTTQLARAGLILGILMGGTPAFADMWDLHITLVPGTVYNGASVNARCMAIMPSGEKNIEVAPGDSITWHVDGTGCTGLFNRNSIKLDFDTAVIETGSMTACMPAGTDKCDITAKVAAPASNNVPNGSRHPYVIRYRGRNAGDPELDINDGSGVPPGARGGRGIGGRGNVPPVPGAPGPAIPGR